MSLDVIERKAEVMFSVDETISAGKTYGPWDVSAYGTIELFVNVVTITGGTTPTVTFVYKALDAFLNGFSQVTFSTLASGSQGSNAVGPAAQTNKAIGLLGNLVVTLQGAPTSAEIQITVIGRYMS